MDPRSISTVIIPEEIRVTGICPQNITAVALKHLHESGIVVLRNAVTAASLDRLNTTMAPEAIRLAKIDGQHFNFGARCGNINQGPPLDDSLMLSDVWVNPFVLSVLAAMLGPYPVLHYACGNTALKAASNGRQPVHSDIEFPHPRFPFSLVVNIPLVDMMESNGATEVWLGSHTATTFDDQVQIPNQLDNLPTRAIFPALLDQRKTLSPPVRTCVSKGSIIIRDLRLWHAGMPNLTPSPRVMLAFVWQAGWWRGNGLVRLPVELRAKIYSWEKSSQCRIAAQWVEKVEDQQMDGVAASSTSLASSDLAILADLSQS
ncbi:hypothetical protein GQX73_g9369 [Xylaria multiplex]|uniref:Phytanoyl-CoA dioxygenase n=1 Tax=Xylaria multiplex TaxID=323545 RepID=A0A7C8MN29_9PEZI|nr:hypothetical protein GQX73_g9369 [Xylaria multiplex]